MSIFCSSLYYIYLVGVQCSWHSAGWSHCCAVNTWLYAPKKASCLRWQVCDSSQWKILLSSFFRTWRQLIVTPPPHPMTLCWCLIMKEAAPKLLVWAPWIPRSQTKTRIMTTWTNGAVASRSWRTCMEAARMTRGLKTDGETDGSLHSCDGKWGNSIPDGFPASFTWDAFLEKRPVISDRIVMVSTL